jgi:hypothetical protein
LSVPAPDADGPPDEALLRYLEDTAEAEEREVVERGISRCCHALDRLLILRQVLLECDA